eukprot:1157251-Pelagomonas_calceolata.AAC.2
MPLTTSNSIASQGAASVAGGRSSHFEAASATPLTSSNPIARRGTAALARKSQAVSSSLPSGREQGRGASGYRVRPDSAKALVVTAAAAAAAIIKNEEQGRGRKQQGEAVGLGASGQNTQPRKKLKMAQFGPAPGQQLGHQQPAAPPPSPGQGTMSQAAAEALARRKSG